MHSRLEQILEPYVEGRAGEVTDLIIAEFGFDAEIETYGDGLVLDSMRRRFVSEWEEL